MLRLSPAFNRGFGKAWLLGGFVFLYLPILALVIYSFNDSPLANVWRGFTLKWYAALMRDDEMLSGLWLSMKVAFFSATGSVVLGTFAAFALVKYKRFWGRTMFSGMVNAPLVMPEVVIGLSLLLMLVEIQRVTGYPDRGAMTIWLGHLLLGMSYATVVVQARLQELNPSLEEAAMDLGAKPRSVFFLITLPMISQAMMSAWLLTFTLSLDDVVVSAFLSGPGSTTMNPSVNAMATLIVMAVSIGVFITSYVIARNERRRQQEIAAAARE
jgi:putrescine transport system permease protein